MSYEQMGIDAKRMAQRLEVEVNGLRSDNELLVSRISALETEATDLRGRIEDLERRI